MRVDELVESTLVFECEMAASSAQIIRTLIRQRMLVTLHLLTEYGR